MKSRFINKYNIFVFITFVILTISYSTNLFKITDDNYKQFDRADEGNVLGRMVLSREKGIFYKGAITGQYGNYKYAEKELTSDNPPLASMEDTNTLAQLYDDYINDREIYGGGFHAYKTQPGGHAMLYSVLQKISPFGGKVNLSFFRFLTVMLSALAFALFLGWVYRVFGFTTAITSFFLVFLTPIFHRFAYNLWWALWSFYIPFVAMLLILERRKMKGVNLFDNKLIVYLAIAIFVKFFFTGAEFITSTLVAAVSPIIFYLIQQNGMLLKQKFVFFIKASIASCLTVVLGLLQLAIQIRYLEGSWAAGFRHVLFSYTKHDTDAEWMGSITRPELFWMYTKNGDVFYWDFFPYIRFGFGALVLVVSMVSVYIWYASKSKAKDVCDRNKALVIATAISIAGPYSWLFFFPAHASFHFFLDYIVWYLPYALLAFVVLGVGLNLLIEQLRSNKTTVQSVDR